MGFSCQGSGGVAHNCNTRNIFLITVTSSPPSQVKTTRFSDVCAIFPLSEPHPRVNRVVDAKSAATLSLRQGCIGWLSTKVRNHPGLISPFLDHVYIAILLPSGLIIPPASARGCSILCTTFPMGQGHPNEIAGRAEEIEISYWTYVSAIKRMAYDQFQRLHKSPVTQRNQ